MSTCRAAATLHRRFTPTRDVLCIEVRVIRGLSAKLSWSPGSGQVCPAAASLAEVCLQVVSN